MEITVLFTEDLAIKGGFERRSAGLVNSDLAWKVSKGRRSASRRAKNTVGTSLKNCAGVICSSSERSNMSEKDGVSVLGCRFSDKAEHVPIKKRRFFFRTPSPPSPPQPVLSFSPTEVIADHSKSQDASIKLAAKESSVYDTNLSQITDNNVRNHAKKSEKASENFPDDEDFSGISILAAAACSSSLGRDCGYAESRSCVEECSMQERFREICTNIEEPSSPRGLVKEELVHSSEISTGGTSSCISTEPVGDLASMSTTVNSLQEVEAGGSRLKTASLGPGSLTLAWDVTHSKDEETAVNQGSSSRDDRFHWDLNLVMDAWEHPFEDSDAHNEHPHKKAEEGGNCSHDDKAVRFEGYNANDKLATTFTEHNSWLPGDPGMLTDRTFEGNKVKNDVDACHNISLHVSSDNKSQLSLCNNDMDYAKCMVEDAKYKHHLESVNNTDKVVVSVLDHGFVLSESGTASEAEGASVKNLKLGDDGHSFCRLALDSLSSFAAASSSELEKLSCAWTSDSRGGNSSVDIQPSLCVSSSPDIRAKAASCVAVLDNLEASMGLHDDGNAIVEKTDLKTNASVGLAHFGISSEKGLLCAEAPDAASSKCEVLINLDSTKVQDVSDSQDGKLAGKKEMTSNHCEIHPVINKETHNSLCSDTDTCKASMDNNSIFSDKIDAVEDHRHGDDADFSCHPVSVVGVSAESKLQEDYDSQYEDGELRETNECVRDQYHVDKEAEQLDYGEEDMEICVTSPTHNRVSESAQVDDRKNLVVGVAPIIPSIVSNIENEVCGKAAEYVGDDETHDGGEIKLSCPSKEKMNACRLEELVEISKSSSEMATNVRDDNLRNDAMSSYGDGLVDSGGIETRMESKAFGRGLRSQIEGPVSHDASSREERLNKMESRYEESSCMRSFDRIRYTLHNQGKGRDHGGWDGTLDGRRGFKRHYSTIVHRRTDVDDDGVVEREDIRCVDSQNDAYTDLRSHYKPGKRFSSPDRPSTFCKERSFRYGLSIDSRAGRGRYNGPSKDESFQSSLKYRRPFSHRERSLSPFGGRGHSKAYHSRGNSPSRSRSRSPFLCHSQRGRPGGGNGGNTFLRHRSRSPNFRSEVRVQRLRSPFHQPGFVADDAVGFRSFPRNYSSPSRSRWTSARKDESTHFREFGCKPRAFASERTPGRNCTSGDRAGVPDSLRNIKPDGYYRFSEDSAGRGLRYEESYEDRRKQFGTIRPTRRSYEDVSRLHQDISDNFPADSIRVRDASGFQGRGLRGIDCRMGDLPRRSRGETHSFIYERDGKFNSNLKQFGADVMDMSINLQSEEQYQSTHTGRFSVLDGPSRGRHYEKYEDRRKQYGVFRHSDLEGTEKRVNHNVDRNFQDASFFRQKGLRNFDGRIGGLSTRLGELQNSVGCRQQGKVDHNSPLLGGQNSDDSDKTNGRISS